MKMKLLTFALLLSIAPAFSQETGLNGRHVGSYGNSGNPPYSQTGSGVSPLLRQPGSQFVVPQSPPPLPPRPVWDTQPTTGHSWQFQQYQQAVPATPLSAPSAAPVQTQPYGGYV